MYTTLTLDNYDALDQWGFFIVTKSVGAPEPKFYTVDLPGGDGKIDLTEALGGISYDNREIEVKLRAIGEQNQWTKIFSDVLQAIHGRRMKIIFSDDAGYYYQGRINVTEQRYNFDVAEMTLKMD